MHSDCGQSDDKRHGGCPAGSPNDSDGFPGFTTAGGCVVVVAGDGSAIVTASLEISGMVKGPAGTGKVSVVATVIIPPGKNESCWKSMDCMAA